MTLTKKPSILSVKTVAESQLFTVEAVHLAFQNGQERHFERLLGTRRGSVMVIPLLNKDTVLLIREYGVGIEDYYLSFPTGVLEADEDPITAANRELQEEVGYAAKTLSLLATLTPAPGYIKRNEGASIVLAEDLYEKRLPGDEPEPLEVVPWPLSQLNDLLAREDFCEDRAVGAVYMLKDKLNHDKP